MKSDTANFVELRAPASLAATQTLTFPGTAGSAGNALTTDGLGNLSWSAVATTSTSVGGDLTGSISNAQIASGAIVDADVSASAAIAQSKIAGLTTDLAGKEPSITAGTTAQYWRGDKTWQTLNTDAVPEGVTNLYFLDSRVRAALLSGYTIGTAAPVAATDTLMEALAKIEGSIAALQGNGQWSTSNGHVYRTSGNVGIGTTTPNRPLSITGAGGNNELMALNNSLGTTKWHWNILGGAGLNLAETGVADGRLFIKDGGNVGIGTTTPSTKLEVVGDIKASGTLLPSKTVANYTAAELNSKFGFTSSTDPAYYQQWIGDDSFASNIATVGGNHVSSMVLNVYDQAGNGPNGIFFGKIPYGGNFKSHGSVLMAVKTDGNVGIGTTTPSQRLHIHSAGTWTGTRVTTAATGSTISDGANFGYDDAYGAYIWNREAAPVILATSNAERVRVDATGNVGIGTTAPSNSQGWNKVLDVSGSNHSKIIATEQSVSAVKVGLYSHASWGGGPSGSVGTESNHPLRLITNYTERVRIDTAGNLGIGTAAPAKKLHVAGDIQMDGDLYGGLLGATRGIWRFSSTYPEYGIFYTEASPDRISFSPNGGGITTPDMVINGSNVGIGTASPASKLEVNGGKAIIRSTDSSWGQFQIINPNDAESALSFHRSGRSPWVMGIGTHGQAGNLFTIGDNVAARVALSDAGNFGIGTTAPGYRLQVGNAGDGSEARANAWNALSDERLKKNFSPIPDALERILSLNGYFYNWKNGEDKKRKIGVKAQEVEKAFPEVVSTGKDGFKSVSYDHLIAPVIEAIKSIYSEVKNQNSDIQELKKEVKQMNRIPASSNLDTIDMAKKIQKVEAENVALKQKNQELEERLNRLEKLLVK